MSPLPEILYAIPRNPVLAVGLPIALGFASSLLGGTRSQTRNNNNNAGSGGPSKGPDSAWYRNLIRPAGTPPNAAFPIVWTALYAGMGWASHLIVRAYDSSVTPGGIAKADSALKLYYTQLLFNQLWSVLFFGSQQMTLALVDIVALLGCITKFAVDAGEVTQGEKVGSGWFLWPYVAWVSYATYLNASYVWLNWDRIRATGKTLP